MGDRFEARISAIENIQEEFGHDIREVKEHLVRLTSLFEDYIKTQAVLPRGPSPVLTQYTSRLSPQSFIPTTNHVTWNWSPQPSPNNVHSLTCFHGNILTSQSAK